MKAKLAPTILNKSVICRDLRKQVLKTLVGHLWHTTRKDRFELILANGNILPEPDIPNSDRWKTSRGPEHYPFVRKLNGVSLFDFENFNSEDYSKNYPNSTWHEFVPFRLEWESAVWIEIDKQKIKDRYVCPSELLTCWTEEKAYGHPIMPNIEAACIGKVPVSSFSRAILINQNGIEKVDLSVIGIR